MRKFFRAALVAAIFFAPAMAFATPPSNYEIPLIASPSGGYVTWPIDGSGYPYVDCPTCSGGGGGGGGPVTAASGAYADGALVTLGTKADTAYAGSGSATQIAIGKGIYNILSSGIPINNTSFGISGTLPAFASTPTVNLGNLNGAATAAGLTTINTTLGSPFQAGGLIGNTSFGISGTLPAFTSTPTFTESTLDATAAPVAPGTATATKSVVIGCLANTTLPTFTAGQQGAVPCDASGRLWVAGVASNVPTYMTAQTSGGPNSLLNYTNGAGAVINSTVKSGAGQLFEVDASNSGSADAWCRLYNLVSDTTGSGTPFKVLYLPHGASPTVISTDIGISFGTGLTLVCTAGAAATDTSTITTANSVMVNMVWK
jgi:hypothetical protein